MLLLHMSDNLWLLAYDLQHSWWKEISDYKDQQRLFGACIIGATFELATRGHSHKIFLFPLASEQSPDASCDRQLPRGVCPEELQLLQLSLLPSQYDLMLAHWIFHRR